MMVVKLMYSLFAGIGLIGSKYPVDTHNRAYFQKCEEIFSVFQESYDTIRLKDTVEINFPLHARQTLKIPSFVEMQANKTSIISFYIKNVSNETVWIFASSNTGGLAPREYSDKLLPQQVILIEYLYAPRPGILDKVITLRWKTSESLGFYKNEIININLKGYRKLE